MREREKMRDDMELYMNIEKARRDIRAKYRALSRDQARQERLVEMRLKPVLDPLREIAENSKIDLRKNEIDEDEEEERSSSVSSTNFFDTEGDRTIMDEKAESDAEDKEKKNLIPSDEMEMQKNLEKYGPIAREYISMHLSKDSALDGKYAPTFSNGGWFLGQESFVMNEDDSLAVGEKTYPASEGLFSLLFLERPENFTKADVANYLDILNTSRVIIGPKGGYKIQRDIESKWKRIIYPILKSRKGDASVSGEGLYKKLSDRNIDYSHWRNLDSIVRRLEILTGEREAGNSAVDEEIEAIVTELISRGVIYPQRKYR